MENKIEKKIEENVKNTCKVLHIVIEYEKEGTLSIYVPSKSDI